VTRTNLLLPPGRKAPETCPHLESNAILLCFGREGVCLCRGREVLAGVVSGHACMAGGPGHEGDMGRFSGGAVKLCARVCVLVLGFVFVIGVHW
jgi:hypothetical protein